MDNLTQEKIDYVIAHINDRPRTKVARHVGISMSSLYRIVREHGGELRYDLMRSNPENIELVKKYYPTMTGGEMQAKFGILKGSAEKIAHRLGIKHTDETMARIRQKFRNNITNNRYKIDYAKSSKKAQIKRRIDQFRVWEGKPQLTKFTIARTSAKVRRTKWYLIKRYAYIETTEPYTLMYDKDTHRINERYYIDKYKLKFIADENNDILEDEGCRSD